MSLQFQGNHIRVDAASQSRFMQRRKGAPSDPGNFSPRESVCVKKLDKSVSDEELLNLFNDGVLLPLCEGMVQNWRIVRDHRTGDSKGYAFVAFKKAAAAKAACTLSGHTIGNHQISVEPLRPRHIQIRKTRNRSARLTVPSNKWNQNTRGNKASKKRPWSGIQTKGRFKLRKGTAGVHS